MTPQGTEICTIMDPPAKSATIQSSEAGFNGILADVTSAGIPAFGGTGVASNSTGETSGSEVARLGWIALIAVVLTG